MNKKTNLKTNKKTTKIKGFDQLEASLKAASDIKFNETIENQRNTVNKVFLDGLKSSTYFRDLFFEGVKNGVEMGLDMIKGGR
jgi:hypothetical protein